MKANKVIIVSNDNQHLWRQFCRLGEMMGDGLHYEPDGKWIAKEYRHLAEILIPETKQESSAIKKLKTADVNTQMLKLLEGKKCKCGGDIKQSRSGAKVAYCEICNQRYVARYKEHK
jgi:hypothetical protein